MNLYESISQETINSIKRDAIKKEIDFLIKDEEEAIDGYEKSKQNLYKFSIPSDEYFKIAKVYDHIIEEEKEHIRELEELLGSENSKSSLNEAIEQKYNKSNPDYDGFLKNVKKYTGSYDYLYGGKVDTECHGYPITIKYFYYNRPYVGGGYNLVTNVLTPMNSLAGDSIQDAVDNAFERNSNTKLSQKEIKEKIINAVASINN